MQMQGNVWLLNSYKHTAKNVVIENNTVVSYEEIKLLSREEYTFDGNGLLLAKSIFNEWNKIGLSYIYEYDALGKLIEATLADEGKYLQKRTEYKYNKDEKKIQELVYDHQDSLNSRVVYTYNSLGNLISEKIYSKTSLLYKEIQYQHDDKENIISAYSKRINISAAKPYMEVQKFNDKNKLIYKSFTEDDTLKWEYFASYNKNDSLIYEEVKNGDGNLQSYSKLTFKKNKRIAMKQYNTKPTEYGLETYYQYDKNGKLLTETLYTPNKERFIYIRTYFYDEKGNWIYCIEEDKKSNIKIIYARKFGYY
jgi:hypothetical protein